jgi:hypothetical protein
LDNRSLIMACLKRRHGMEWTADIFMKRYALKHCSAVDFDVSKIDHCMHVQPLEAAAGLQGTPSLHPIN